MKTGSEKQLQHQVLQLTTQRDIAQKQVKDLEKVNEGLNIRRLRMYDSLMIEKLDLIGRIARIDQRIGALGLPVATKAGCDIKLDGIADLGK